MIQQATQTNDGVAKIPLEFPDQQTCRVRRSTFVEDFFECCNVYRTRCPYCVTLGRQHFCRHPGVQSILKWSI